MAKINLLSPLLSSRIAAGEIIERPASVLRELLDNAIDAGATEINVVLEGGGIDLLSVSDNGSGISREDLALIGNRHATSKLHTLDDLYDISTLGFRGEALYSISSVSRLTISTFSKDTNQGSTLVIDNGKRKEITSNSPNVGTVITVENLFSEIPARRAFLKRNATEATVCKNLLISKALAFPNIKFVLTVDGATKLFWPACSNLKDRAMYLYKDFHIANADVNYLTNEYNDFSIQIVAGNSAVKRSDRKEIRIYVNGRPVEDYSLVQAVTYGYGELLPGGSFPYAIVFIYDKPELVDFNIHPTKKEVKLRNANEIHHAVSSLLKGVERVIPELKVTQFYLDDAERWENEKKEKSFQNKNFLLDENLKYKTTNKDFPKKEDSNKSKTFNYDVNSSPSTLYKTYEPNKDWLDKVKELKDRANINKNNSISNKSNKTTNYDIEEDDDITYIGQAFKLFLICQKGNNLYLIDQHAAHERILYEEILSQKTVQNLLVPIKLELEEESSKSLSENSHIYTKLGILISQSNNVWQIDAIPAILKGSEKEIIDFINNNKLDEHELEMKLFAIIACKAAIKAGDSIDKWAAESLCREVFKLKEPCCPHGRTFLIKISEDKLREMVGRT